MDLTTYYNLQRFLDNKTYPVGSTAEQQRKIQNQSKHYLQIDGILYKINRRKEPTTPLRVIKENEMEAILINLHSNSLSGHFGFEGTFQRIANRYWWNGMGTDIKNYVKTCEICQQTGGRTTRQPLHPIKIGQPFDRIVIDLVGSCKLSTNGNWYIITAIDYLTKWPEAKPIPDKKAITIAKFIFEEIICRHGCPKEIQSDNGLEFANEIVRELSTKFGIKQKFSSPYHPQTNGIIERFNRTLCTTLQKLTIAHEQEWDTLIPAALFAYRTNQNSTTKHEPFFLTYGRTVRLPIELKIPIYLEINSTEEEKLLQRIYHIIDQLPQQIIEAQQNIEDRQLQYTQRYNDKIQKETIFKIGNKVLLFNMKQYSIIGDKFQPTWSNEWYYIHSYVGYNSYKLWNQNGKILKHSINGRQLKHYHDRQDYFEPQIIIE